MVRGDRAIDPGFYWNLLAIARSEPAFEVLLAERVTEANLSRGNWARLVRPSFDTLPDLDQYADPRLRAFTRSLYCDLYDGWGDEDLDALLAMADERAGYFDTHLLMGLRLVEANGCNDPARLEAEVQKVAHRLLAALGESPRYEDLFVERIVFLYWAGRGDEIERVWIERILESQNADHGWGNTPESPSNPHSSTLSVMALTYYREGLARQPFPYPVEARRVGPR
jgi:hypothetical protein